MRIEVEGMRKLKKTQRVTHSALGNGHISQIINCNIFHIATYNVFNSGVDPIEISIGNDFIH